MEIFSLVGCLPPTIKSKTEKLSAPQHGAMDIRTEMGNLRVRAREICVLPRGIRFQVSLPAGPVRGFALELYSGHFDLPELGPIGSVGLANVRDFEIPKASFIDSTDDTELIAKFVGKIHRTMYRGNIFNVVGWHGTYYPYKYDLVLLLGSPCFLSTDIRIGEV